jgi:FkbM family methyltransferase
MDGLTKIRNKVVLEYMNAFRTRKSFSQCGEDLIIEDIFKLRGIENPTYIDIGANDPFFISNTARFYRKGSRGINIEANDALLQRFLKYRSKDINLNIGISDEEGEMDFYIMTDDTLSTFSKEQADSMASSGTPIKEIKKVKILTVSAILEKYLLFKFPDFLSLDVEGLDLQILQSIDYSQSYPKVICVEIAEYSPTGTGLRKNDIADFLISKDYYEYANTNLNAIMVKKEFWFNNNHNMDTKA